jgi:hypothetical protein
MSVLTNRIQLTSQEIQVLAEGLDSIRWDRDIKHARSAAKKLFKQAERFDPILSEHLTENFPQTAWLAGKKEAA